MKRILLPPFFCLPPGKITNHGDAENNAISTLDTAFADSDLETIRQHHQKDDSEWAALAAGYAPGWLTLRIRPASVLFGFFFIGIHQW
jgi:hypothetical protein